MSDYASRGYDYENFHCPADVELLLKKFAKSPDGHRRAIFVRAECRVGLDCGPGVTPTETYRAGHVRVTRNFLRELLRDMDRPFGVDNQAVVGVRFAVMGSCIFIG